MLLASALSEILIVGMPVLEYLAAHQTDSQVADSLVLVASLPLVPAMPGFLGDLRTLCYPVLVNYSILSELSFCCGCHY